MPRVALQVLVISLILPAQPLVLGLQHRIAAVVVQLKQVLDVLHGLAVAAELQAAFLAQFDALRLVRANFQHCLRVEETVFEIL